ncbi:hypothetical protein DAI22_08g124700 [Oryza sativa Japonica Group]|nr:hypothetical protein DAI22_08g124700 [Oryza sativa Japonica Group]
MEVEPPRLQPAFSRRCRAHNRAEPDPPTSRPPPLGSSGGAVAPPTHQRRTRSRLSPLCPQPMPCRIHLVTPHHPRTTTTSPPRRRFSSSLNRRCRRSSSMPRRHRNSRRRSSVLHGEPHAVADP